MRVDALTLEGWRNYQRQQLTFDDGCNVIYGENAQGKTNLLEAMVYLSCGKSPRAHGDRELIGFDRQEASVTAQLLSRERAFTTDIQLFRGKRRKMTVNGVPAKTNAALSDVLHTVFFCPEDLFLIRAGAAERRRFMDLSLCQLRPGYAEALAANGQLYKAIPIDHNKPSINELTEYFKFKFNPAKRTLIFVQNQWALPRVYKALQPMAHLLPQQIGLLGLNCEDWTNLTTPTVSTIIEPVDQEGREAAEMLLALLDGSGEPGEQRILECRLNWLGSTSI